MVQGFGFPRRLFPRAYTFHIRGNRSLRSPILQPQHVHRTVAVGGDEEVNNSGRLSFDPARRHVVGGRAALTDKQATSTSEVACFETEILCIRQQPEKSDGEKSTHDERQSSTKSLAGRCFR